MRARVAVIRMLSTVDLDDELRRSAEEVDDIGSKRMLAAETEPCELLAAQPRPQPDLGIRGCAAQIARERRGHASMVTSADLRRHPPPGNAEALPSSPSRGEGLDGEGYPSPAARRVGAYVSS